MSISTLQEKLFNKGCGTAFMVVAAIAMLAGMVGQCGRNGDMANGPNGEGGGANAVATVDGIPVPAERIQADVARANVDDLSAQALFSAQATANALRGTALKALIAREPAITADEVGKAAGVAFDEAISQEKMQRMMKGELKPDATDADLERLLKAELGGKTLAQLRGDRAAAIQKAFADAGTKVAVVEQFAEPILAARYGAKLAGDDAGLRESYKNYILKRVFFSARSGSAEAPEARAEKALAALKSGTKFDKLMDEVSNDPPRPGQKVHDVTETVPADALASRPELADLKGKPAGTLGGVVDVPGGKAIYRIDTIQSALPADFDKNVARYRDQRAAVGGRAEVQARVAKLLDGEGVAWKSKGYQALAAAASAGADATKASKAADLAQAAIKAGDADKRLGVLALLVLTDPQNPNHAGDRTAALEAMGAAGLSDAKLSVELAKLYGTAKNGAKATEALLAASKANARYDAAGQQTWGDVNAAANDFQKSGVLTKEQLAEVQAQQAIWTETKKATDAAEAEAKKQAAETEKANAAELARQKAEAEKNAPKATTPGPKAPPAGTTGAPPTSTGAGGGSLLPPTTTGAGKP